MLTRKKKRHPYDANTVRQLDNETPSIGIWVAASTWAAALIMAVVVFVNHPKSKNLLQFSERAEVTESVESDDKKKLPETKWNVKANRTGYQNK